MAELKSAWEIAQGKADKLGKLSAEELRQQGEEKCRQIGEAIAQRYLDNVEPLNLGIELDKHLEEERELIKRAVASRLIQAMDLRFFTSFRMTDKLEKTIQGIASLEPQSRAITERLRQLFQEYEGATREARHEIERKDKEILHRLRISGTAVGDINVEAMPQWQQTWHRLRKPFEPRLDNLKQELINCIVGSALSISPKNL